MRGTAAGGAVRHPGRSRRPGRSKTRDFRRSGGMGECLDVRVARAARRVGGEVTSHGGRAHVGDDRRSRRRPTPADDRGAARGTDSRSPSFASPRPARRTVCPPRDAQPRSSEERPARTASGSWSRGARRRRNHTLLVRDAPDCGRWPVPGRVPVSRPVPGSGPGSRPVPGSGPGRRSVPVPAPSLNPENARTSARECKKSHPVWGGSS